MSIEKARKSAIELVISMVNTEFEFRSLAEEFQELNAQLREHKRSMRRMPYREFRRIR